MAEDPSEKPPRKRASDNRIAPRLSQADVRPRRNIHVDLEDVNEWCVLSPHENQQPFVTQGWLRREDTCELLKHVSEYESAVVSTTWGVVIVVVCPTEREGFEMTRSMFPLSRTLRFRVYFVIIALSLDMIKGARDRGTVHMIVTRARTSLDRT